MKKILVAAAIMSAISVGSMFGTHHPEIKIKNDCDFEVIGRDDNGHQVSVGAHRSAVLRAQVKEHHGCWFPSLLAPYVGNITVTDADDASNSQDIDVDEHTRSVTVNPSESGFELSKGDDDQD